LLEAARPNGLGLSKARALELTAGEPAQRESRARPPTDPHMHQPQRSEAAGVTVQVKERTMKELKTPDITTAQIVAVVGAAIALAVAFGLDISQEKQDAIKNLVIVLAPVLLAADA
jgi:hypothetical protein